MTLADTSNSIDEARLNEAAEWLITLREKPTDPQTIAAWLQWRQAHPDNPRAFSEIEEIWTLTGGAESALTLQSNEQQAAATVIPLSNTKRSSDTNRHRPWVRWGIAASLAAMVLLSAIAWRSELFKSGEPTVEYATAQAAQRELRLSDGSTIMLGGNSAVRVSYTGARRNIALLRGEAHFAVHHDTHRPFVVATRAIAVTAVGTAFNVRADGARIVVSVSEGVVEVGPGTGKEEKQPTLQSTLRARAGQQVVLDSATDSHATLSVRLSDAPTPNDWQQGLLSFVDEPLSSVVARINRYSQHNIVIHDPAIGELHFTGTVFRDRIGDWALGLEKAFPIEADTDARGDIRLVNRQSMPK